MMGERTVMQEALFYSFRIEDHVPQDHLLRSVDRFVDLDLTPIFPPAGIRAGRLFCASARLKQWAA